jgi:hypothetical protein
MHRASACRTSRGSGTGRTSATSAWMACANPSKGTIPRCSTLRRARRVRMHSFEHCQHKVHVVGRQPALFVHIVARVERRREGVEAFSASPSLRCVSLPSVIGQGYAAGGDSHKRSSAEDRSKGNQRGDNQRCSESQENDGQVAHPRAGGAGLINSFRRDRQRLHPLRTPRQLE